MPAYRLTEARRRSRLEPRLLACGAIGPPLFVLASIVAGAVRPHYNPLRHPVSSLALSESGWIQVANFLVTGVLLLAFAVGLRPAWRRYGGGASAPILVGLVAIGLIGSGVFPTDPISGYPPGTPQMPHRTVDGALHDAFGAAVFLGLPAACGVAGHRFASAGRRAWAGYSIGTAVLVLTGLTLFSIGFSQHPAFMPIGGVLQRCTIIVGWTWLAALALHLLRQRTPTYHGPSAEPR